MPTIKPKLWVDLALAQSGLVARRQLLRLGFDSDYLDDQVAAGRWQQVSEVVASTTTGVLTREQLMWAGVLHAGRGSAIGGLTALEPAALLYAGYTRSASAALGLIAAAVQQRLTTPERLLIEIDRMQPLRRAKRPKSALGAIGEGSHSLAELRVLRMCRTHDLPLPVRQTRRRDASGRVRYTDAEWRLPSGKVVILEVDGAFHMDVEHWEGDIIRERDLVTTGAVVLRCTDRELADEPSHIARSLRAVGVGQSSA